jgi:hypothetical protein
MMARADMTKIDKADTAKIDKSDMVKSDMVKNDMVKNDRTEVTKIDLDAMSIEELATLRDNASAKLLEKVTARQVELEAEIERLAQYGKPSKKAVASAPIAKTKKAKAEEISDIAVSDNPAADKSVAEAA